jgi:hypothetical protein
MNTGTPNRPPRTVRRRTCSTIEARADASRQTRINSKGTAPRLLKPLRGNGRPCRNTSITANRQLAFDLQHTVRKLGRGACRRAR